MLYNNRATDKRARRPNCDLCGRKPAAVDAKTRDGPWGYLCLDCHGLQGGMLGLGIGQVLLCGDGYDARYIAHYGLEKA